MSEIKGKISRRQLLKMASPLGKVTLDKARCTGCGLCTLDCPSEALTVTPGEKADTYQLLFRHNLCVACGQCVEACPEGCLHLERTLEPDEINRPPAVLFEDEIVRCSGCGRPLASRAMINHIKARLAGAGASAPFELCPECKAKVTLSQLGK